MRIKSLDSFKTIACLMVVFIHASNSGVIEENIIPLTRIAVPFFFMVTGFFMYKSNKHAIKKQIHKVINLVVVSNLFYFFVELFQNPDLKRSFYDLVVTIFDYKTILKFTLFNVEPFKIAEHLWYLLAILYVLLIYKQLSGTKYERILIKIVPILLITDLIFGKYSWIIFHREFPYILLRNYIFVGLPYFYIGYIIRENYEHKKFVNYKNSNLICFIIFFIVTSILEKNLISLFGHVPARDHYISTTFLVISLFIFLINNPEFLSNNLINDIGKKYSTYIYVIHPFLIYLFNGTVLNLPIFFITVYKTLSPFIIFVISLLISIFIDIVFNRKRKRCF